MSIFGGAFLEPSPEEKEKYLLANPKKSVPRGIEMGEPWEYETYGEGEEKNKGTITDSFTDGEYQYVVVHFNNNAPSDETDYVYLYDELDEEDQMIQDIEVG